MNMFPAKKLVQFNKCLDEFQSKCEVRNVDYLTLSSLPKLLLEDNTLIVDNLESSSSSSTPVNAILVKSGHRKNKTIDVPQEIEMWGRKFFHSSVAAENHSNDTDYFVTFRRGNEFNNWWCCDKNPSPQKMSRWEWLSSNKGCNVMI